MIQLSEQELEEFKLLWLKRHGEMLNDHQAQAEASRLVRQLTFLSGMLP